MNDQAPPDATRTDGPHQQQPLREAGAPLAQAQAAMVMVHGRGATARSILALADDLDQPHVAYRAPQAAGRSWYPYSFLAPLAENEPGLSSALQVIDDALATLETAGIAPERTALLGFSQGACLSLEWLARRGRHLGGVVALSGALIGSGEREGGDPPKDKRFEYETRLEGVPVFLGCSDRDPHIPLMRVRDSAEVFRGLGADVDERIYEGLGHTVNADEVEYTRALLARLTQADASS